MNDGRKLKWVIGTLCVVLAAAIVAAALAVRWNTVPVIRIPTHKMPWPNAYDFYVRAGSAIVDKEKIGFAISEAPHPPQPARPPASPPSLDRDYSLAEKEAIVRANANALSILRQGFSYEYMNPPCRSFNTPFPHFARDRDMARLLVVESQVKAGHGDWGGAMDSCLDAVRMGQDVPRGGSLIAALVGVAMQTIGRNSAWKNVDKLDASETRAAVLRMDDILARQVSFADTMQEEKWSSQAGLIEMFNQPGWRKAFLSNPSGSSSYPSASGIVGGIMSLTWSKGRTLNSYSRYMDQYIKNSRLPYAAMPSAAPNIPNDPICQIMCPVFERARATVTKAEAQNVLLTITLALHAHRLERGHYPSKLDQLKNSYLSRIPDDPFGPKGPPKYRRLGDKYLLYSVGPDAKDDGGKAIFDKSQTAPPGAPPSRQKWPYRVSPDSKGDVVAGVNVL